MRYLLLLMVLINFITNSFAQKRKQAEIPTLMVGLKTQFPIQHAAFVEFVTPVRFSGLINYGQFSRFYTIVALDVIQAKNEAAETRRVFIKERLENGKVLELGMNYHYVKKKLYGGLSLQFQQFKMSGTAQEFVENFDADNSKGFKEKIEKLVNRNARLEDFYENTVLRPQIRPIQLGFLVGKRFTFSRIPKLGVHLELAYHLNIGTKVDIEAANPIAQVLMDSYINPIIQEKSKNSFDSFNLPSLSLKINYGLGKKSIIKLP